MELNEDTVKSQVDLSEVNREFLDFVKRTPESLKRSNFKLLELRNELFSLQPWPTFISLKSREAFKDAGEKIFNIIKCIPRRVFNYDFQKMSNYYETPLSQVETEMEGFKDEYVDSLVGRGDFVISPSGLKCLEYNIAASMGGWQIPIWEVFYLNHPIIAKFVKEYGIKPRNENLISAFLEHIVSCTLSKIPGCDSEISIAFTFRVSDEGMEKRMTVYLTGLLNEILKRKHNGVTGNIFVCDYSRPVLKNNCLYINGKRIHVVTEMQLGDISEDVRIAYKAGNIRLIIGPSTPLLSHKLNLSLLSDYETTGIFSDEEKKAIDAYIPWTRKVSSNQPRYKGEKISNMETFLLSNRENMVLKPSWGFGGDDVCVGRSCPKEEWEAAVQKAINGRSWLVQEYLKPNTGYYQLPTDGYDIFDMVWGFFVFGNRYTGAWVRVMPQKGSKGVINCHQGAGVSIIFEVDK